MKSDSEMIAAIVEEVNEDIAGLRRCYRAKDFDGVSTAISALLTARNISRRLGLSSLEKVIQRKIHTFEGGKVPGVIK